MSRPIVALALALFALAPGATSPAIAQATPPPPIIGVGTLGGLFSTLGRSTTTTTPLAGAT